MRGQNDHDPSTSSGGLTDPFTYRLKLAAGLTAPGVRLHIYDYPGGWVNSRTRPDGVEESWQECLRFIADSTVLIVPIDATVLMEAQRPEHHRAVPAMLTTDEVAEIAGTWAKERARQPEEPALLLLCPVKCESYFDDNRNLMDRSRQLADEVRRTYRDLLDVVRRNAMHTKVCYCPIDTIGCVQLTSSRRRTGSPSSRRSGTPTTRPARGISPTRTRVSCATSGTRSTASGPAATWTRRRRGERARDQRDRVEELNQVIKELSGRDLIDRVQEW